MDILKGGSFFYRYAPIIDGAEKPVAIVELRRMPVIGWVVHEALARTTKRLPAATAPRSLRIFAAPASAPRRRPLIRMCGLICLEDRA